MKSASSILSVVMFCCLVGVAGCGKKETPTPTVVSNNQSAPPKVELAPQPAPTPPTVPPRDPDRQAAEWALAMGGTIVVDDGQKKQNVGVVAQLPKQDFQLTAVHLNLAKNVTDDSLKELNAVQLSILDLSKSAVTDHGLTHVGAQKKLSTLVLDGTRITDKGLAHLQGLKLQNLHLTGTQVTGVGFQELPDMRVTLIGLANCPVADEALPHFAKLPNLRALDLSNTKISDKGLAHLQPCPWLETLIVNGTPVSDEGLHSLETMTKLHTLGLKGTKVTDAGVAELAKALPKLKIER